jgi:hypothetical protein
MDSLKDSDRLEIISPKDRNRQPIGWLPNDWSMET